MKKRFFIAIVLVFIFSTLIFLFLKTKRKKIQNQKPAKTKILSQPYEKRLSQNIEIIAQNLRIPWEVVFLPDKRIIITERPGTVKLLNQKSMIEEYEIKDIFHYGEGGLLGAAIHPNFEKNKYVYLYMTYKKGKDILNKIIRYRLENGLLKEDKLIIDSIKGAIYHNGGRIAFGPDGFLYITTGDATKIQLAQDPKDLNGKILRIKDDGSIPDDNPFKNPVYSYGHRNPQGLAWDENKNLWITEHGPSGLQSGFDEINQIIKGKNYGWPKIFGDKEKEGMIKPVIHSGANETWAPAGATFYKRYLFFAGLRGKSLYRFDPKTKEIKAFLKNKFGRLRAVVLGPDGYLYISTSNTDGRGKPKENDDKIIKIDPNIFLNEKQND